MLNPAREYPLMLGSLFQRMARFGWGNGNVQPSTNAQNRYPTLRPSAVPIARIDAKTERLLHLAQFERLQWTR